MYNLYNPEADHYSESLIISFRKFLIAEKIAKGTVRSYVSDVRSFFNWLLNFLNNAHIFKADSPTLSDAGSLLALINPRLLSAYGDYLRNKNAPLTTINRRYSALRKLGSFSVSQALLAENVFESLKTISESPAFNNNVINENATSVETRQPVRPLADAASLQTNYIERLARLGIEAEIVQPTQNIRRDAINRVSTAIKSLRYIIAFIICVTLGIGIYGQTQNNGQVLGSADIISPLSSVVNVETGHAPSLHSGLTGSALIPSGLTEIKIANSYVTKNSLVYLTPIGSTDNQVLYIKELNYIEKTITVGIDRETSKDLKFNWWIIN